MKRVSKLSKENIMLRDIIRNNAEFERHLYKQYTTVVDIYRRLVEDLKRNKDEGDF
jgi:hypothetical protein